MTYKHGFRREPSSDGPKGETGSAGRMLISGWGSSLFLRTFPVIFFEFIQIFFFFQSDNFSATLDLSEMSLVVEQTLPYTTTELKLEDPQSKLSKLLMDIPWWSSTQLLREVKMRCSQLLEPWAGSPARY